MRISRDFAEMAPRRKTLVAVAMICSFGRLRCLGFCRPRVSHDSGRKPGITVRARAQGLRRIDEQLIEAEVGWRGIGAGIVRAAVGCKRWEQVLDANLEGALGRDECANAPSNG